MSDDSWEFPSNDLVLHEVAGVLQGHSSGVAVEDVRTEVAARIDVPDGWLTGKNKNARLLASSIRFCLEILQREELAIQREKNWRPSRKGMAADSARIDKAWANELERLNYFDRRLVDPETYYDTW